MSEYPIEWYENIKAEKLYFDGQDGKNVKSCPSFIEIYQEGYVIPSPTETEDVASVLPPTVLIFPAPDTS